MEEKLLPSPPNRPLVAPGLLTAIHLARGATHVFLVIAGIGTLAGIGDHSGDGFAAAAVCIGLFLLSYFTWVGLVLFGCMNFALSVMLGFVLALGACIGLLMSKDGLLVALGGFGLFAMVFIAVIPISQYDPTTPPQPRPGGVTLQKPECTPRTAERTE